MELKKKGRLTLIAGLVLVSAPTVAYAHGGNDDPNVVHACVGNVSKVARIVGVSGSCIASPPLVAETPAHWDIQGPAGAPGVNGINGINGTNGTNGTNGIDGTDGKDGQDLVHADPPCFDNVNRYVDCGNGTVTDTVTGLIWLKPLGCVPQGVDWAAANQAAALLKAGDCGPLLTDKSSPGDWRLPTRAEWEAMIARAWALGCSTLLTNDAGTACSGAHSLSGSGLFWSSSADELTPSNAWNVVLTPSSIVVDPFFLNAKSDELNVWPVRGGR
jgi:Protein of unknown function (DUF1566)